MSATVPVKTSRLSPLPSPEEKLRPATPLSVSVPPVTESDSCTGLAPASMSEIEIALPLALAKTIATSSLVVCGPGSVRVGASLTAFTLTVTAVEAVSGPPAPVLPRSSTVTATLAAPLKFAVGPNVKPSRAALMSAIVPVKTSVASFVPVPVVNVNPVVPLSDKVPSVAVSVTLTGPPASRSAIEIELPPAEEKTSVESSSIV